MATAEEIAAGLDGSRLYVDPAVTGLTADDEQRMRAALEDSTVPVFVAIVETATDAGPIASEVGQDGVYLLVTPAGAGDTATYGGVAAGVNLNGLAEQSVRASGDLPEMIEQFAAGVNSVVAGSGRGRSSGRGGGGGLMPLALLAAVGGGGFLLHRRNQRARDRSQLETVQGALEEDITSYGEELSVLDLDLRTSPDAAESQEDYARALDLYESAKRHARDAERPADLKSVTQALEEGRWLLARVRARVEGEPLPDRRPPCFFDPRHGPSVADVQWSPPGGTPREVPACAADAVRIRDGQDPDVRMVRDEQGGRSPYWDAGPAYGAWAGGYYAGVLPAMFMGTMMGSMMGGGFAGGMGGGFDGGGFDGGGFDGGGFDGGGFDGGGFGGFGDF